MANKLGELFKKDKMKVVGLISGTSADGVDAALCEIGGTNLEDFTLELIKFYTEPYPNSLRDKVLELSVSQQGTTEDVCRLNFQLGQSFANAAAGVIQEAGLTSDDLDLIGTHGQTIAHLPPREISLPNNTTKIKPGSTLQIGEPAVIAEELKTPVVSNFRARDMAAKGQGAPLVPLVDYFLFTDPDNARAVVNIGGISNMTYLPAAAKRDEIVAFDTGPGNMIIDALIQLMTKNRQHYDKNGEMAAKGQVDGYILSELLKHPYLEMPPPKSTGREEFGARYAARIYEWGIRRAVKPTDTLRTVTDFTAIALADAYKRFVLPMGKVSEVVISGGGALNDTLMTRLKKEFGEATLVVSDEIGMPLKGKEAIAFAVLARECVLGRPGNIALATGAAGPRILGQITPA